MESIPHLRCTLRISERTGICVLPQVQGLAVDEDAVAIVVVDAHLDGELSIVTRVL